MNGKTLGLLVLLTASPLPLSAEEALDPATATALRKELDAIRNEYEGRIAALESRIKELESQPAPPAAPKPTAPAPRRVARTQPLPVTEEESDASEDERFIGSLDAFADTFAGDT